MTETNTNNQRYDIAIVLPALNEEKGISNVINSIKEALDNRFSYKIIVVDNLSQDNTAKIAREMNTTVIKQRIRGYGSTLQAGFYYVEKNFKTFATVMMDSDGTYDPNDIPKMIEIIKNDEADFVIGNRFHKMDKNAMTTTNKIGNKILSSLSRKLLGINVNDFSSGMRVFRSHLLKIFYNRSIDFPYATEMLLVTKMYNIRIKEIPISYHVRIGKTKLTPFKDGAALLGTIIRLMRDSRPLVFFGIIGSVFVGIGLLTGLEIIIEWLKTGGVSRIARTILSALFIMSGIQIMSFGLISDMIKGKNDKFTALID